MRLLTLGGKMLTAALREQGHEVAHLGLPGTAGHPHDHELDWFLNPAAAAPAARDLAFAFRPDWILQVDDSTPSALFGLETLDFPKAWYAVDSHLHMEWHRHYAPLFDLVFCAQRNRMADLGAFLEAEGGATGASGGIIWLPLGTHVEPEFRPWGQRRLNAVFVGTIDAALNPARSALLDGLKIRGSDVHVVQGDFRPIFPDARVVLNQSVRDDLNLRCFEAMGKGALLITDRISHSLDAIGIPGTDFLTYTPGDADDLRDKIAWALAHPVEAEAMARRGHARVLEGHRMAHRIAALTGALADPLAVAGSPTGRMTALAHLAAAQEHLSRLALPPHVTAFFATEARRNALASLALADPTDPADASRAGPHALLALAQLDFETGDMSQALAWLEKAEGMDGGVGYRRRYLALLSLAQAHNGAIEKARRTVSAGLVSFPDDADLGAIARALGVPEARA